MVTEKSEHWLNIVFRDTPYVIPGVEGIILPSGDGEFGVDRPTAFPQLQNGLIRYNTDINQLETYVGNAWQTIVSGNVPLIHVIATENLLSGITPVNDGELATVLDNGGTGEEAMYVWNSANPDLGPPFNKWRILATSGFIPRVAHRNARITSSVSPALIGGPVLASVSPMIKEINVDIISAYDPGVTLDVYGDAGGIIMGTLGSVDSLVPEINPQLEGTYTKQIPGVNLTDGAFAPYVLNGSGQIRVMLSATGGAGIAQIYIKYIIQN